MYLEATKLLSAATSPRGYPIGPLCFSALYLFGISSRKDGRISTVGLTQSLRDTLE